MKLILLIYILTVWRYELQYKKNFQFQILFTKNVSFVFYLITTLPNQIMFFLKKMYKTKLSNSYLARQ